MVRTSQKPKEIGLARVRSMSMVRLSGPEGDGHQALRFGRIIDQRQGGPEKRPVQTARIHFIVCAGYVHYRSTMRHRALQPPCAIALISATITS